MEFEYMFGILRSVSDAIADPALDGQMIALHGVLYSGPEFHNDIVLLPKDGWFNGTGLFEVATNSDARKSVIVFKEPKLEQKLSKYVGVAFGMFKYKYDCVAVGRIHQDHCSYAASVADVQLMLLQSWREYGSKQLIFLLQFPENSPPPIPTISSLKVAGLSVLKILPAESNG